MSSSHTRCPVESRRFPSCVCERSFRSRRAIFVRRTTCKTRSEQLPWCCLAPIMPANLAPLPGYEVHVWLLKVTLKKWFDWMLSIGLAGILNSIMLKLKVLSCWHPNEPHITCWPCEIHATKRFKTVNVTVFQPSASSPSHMEISATFCLMQPLHLINTTTVYVWVRMDAPLLSVTCHITPRGKWCHPPPSRS